ncbi:MAG: PspA/IM30 family protein [Actinomycetota bacterium]|jgi:phage shock protein A|nr:PspA/IM30 family protein [Actinomycetota bacterium]
MAIFSRLADLLKANINDLIDKAEDPEKMVKQIIIDMEEQLQNAVQGLGSVMASERQMLKQLEDAKAQSKLWEDRAKTALKESNEELAKQAVDNKLSADTNVKQYQKMSDDISSQLKILKNQVEILKQKLGEARNRQTMLLARDKVAEAKKEVSGSLGGLDSSGAFAKMDKMERKIAEKEAQADAAFEISGLDAELNDPFTKIEKNKAAEEELQRLKDELSNE